MGSSGKQTTRKPKAVKGNTKKSQAIKSSSTTVNNRVVRRTNNHSTGKQSTAANRWSRLTMNSSNKTAKTVRRNFANSQRTGKQHEVVKSIVVVPGFESCVDTFALMGSLSCDELFARYHNHYCKRNQTVRRKCCASFQKYCVPR